PIGSAAAEIQRAKAICARCPVQLPCLTYALATSQEFGIWGGRDEAERRLLHWQWRESRLAARTDTHSHEPGPEPRPRSCPP
ncbi:MAG TPA: WhiB family transcriptional regulator, partial [Streptosporangiaceae bacterium]